MKAIELTKEQQKKLLEMCKALFPELTDLEIRDSMEDFCFKFEHICIEYGRNNNNLVIIHWFEFCMTHLATVLICKNKKHMQQLFMGLKHPVDYLYEEFKKLSTKGIAVEDKIEKIVFQQIERVLGEEVRTLNEKLSELGLDDLDQIELIMYIEQTLGIFIDDDDVENKIFKPSNTIKTLVDYVKSKV